MILTNKMEKTQRITRETKNTECKFCISCNRLLTLSSFKELWCGLKSSQCIDCDDREEKGYIKGIDF